jgi:hypothetical protein
MSHDAFISYSSLDKAAANATCAALEASGIRCWIAPRDIEPGSEWGDAIIDAINHSRVVILIFSAHANDSRQIRREVERAVSKGIPIIPLRIENIAPTHSLEFFIGTLHWLDALTPPLENHLRRLVETVKTLLQIDPKPPHIVSPSVAPASPAFRNGLSWRALAAILLACLGLSAAAIGIWWISHVKAPPPQPAASLPTSPQAPSEPVKASVDPALIGTFAHAAVVDGYDARYVYSIAPDGTCRLVTTLQETGTFQAGNGHYRTVEAKTGRVRMGTYRAVGSTAIAVTSAGGTAIFQPIEPITPIDQANPVMLGIWRATVVRDGVTWTWTIQNNSDGTYQNQGQSEDSGSCTFADQRWQAKSAVTGRSDTGTYRVVDAHDVEITSLEGTAVWQRQ